MPRKENPGPISAQQQQDLVSEGIDNFELPKSIVTKIAKSAVPESTKLQKEAILSLVKGSTVFINYLAATQAFPLSAHDVAQSKQHKSISASDVLKALEMIELGDLVEPLSAELQAYRDLNKNDKGRRASTSASARSKTDAAVIRLPSGHDSVSVPSKTKGKEKSSAPSAPLFVSAPLGSASGGVPTPDAHLPPPPKSSAQTDSMVVDDGATVEATAEVEDVDQEMSEDEISEDESDEVGVEDDLQDVVALEAEELQQDARGVEERSASIMVENVL